MTACADIDQWPNPIPGMSLNLPLMGMILHVRIPTKQDRPGTTVLNGGDKVINYITLYYKVKNISFPQLLKLRNKSKM